MDAIGMYDVIWWVDTKDGERKRVHHALVSESASNAASYVKGCIIEAGHTPVALALCVPCTGTRN